MEKKKLEEYAVLDAKIKSLTQKKDDLKIEIMEELLQSEEKTVTIAFGKFTIANLKSWTYTPKVAELESLYKAQKATEESTGDATFVEKPSLRFITIKL